MQPQRSPRRALGTLLGDPRLSLEERYKTHARSVREVEMAARMLKGQRFLLQEDVDRIVQEAQASDVLR
jgi:hypothetical protein